MLQENKEIEKKNEKERAHTNWMVGNTGLFSEKYSSLMHILLHQVIVQVKIQPLSPQIKQTQIQAVNNNWYNVNHKTKKQAEKLKSLKTHDHDNAKNTPWQKRKTYIFSASQPSPAAMITFKEKKNSSLSM